LKWPLGDTTTNSHGGDAHDCCFHRSDAAQHALLTLTALVARIVSPTAASGGLFAPAPAAELGFDSSASVLAVFAPYVKHHAALITAVREELVSVLTLMLEWIAADYSHVQNARFVHELLVCLINASAAQSEAEALTSAELILTHAKHLIYQAHGECVCLFVAAAKHLVRK
jgi:hypothetical protein